MAELFLGGAVDAASHERTGTDIRLPAGDFTTHGVIVGMTGSGKTGLGIVLIEECLTAGIPALLIDPKGDLTNLCLTFPGLSAAEFRPWINEGDAVKDGITPDEHAAKQAELWRTGLAGWGFGPEQITALRERVDFTIYTPGSTAGVPVNIVGSLQAPADTNDLETTRDEIEGYVAGLLGLVGVASDPLSSREHILLANLIETSWAAGRSLDLATLVGQVQSPPLRKLGVFELDTFFPPDDRMALAMRLNGLLASPSFAAWAQGPALDIDALLHDPAGRPRCAILTTAHLSDEERQFVTALVLAKVVTWMRRQSGTTDLRALVYMDEVAGYVPPTANPPTKKPIMTLMKQARAFGVGTVLATQNPVDVDYKALSNAGTWMIGRLQTERDKARLLDGMSAAAGGVDVQAVGDTISGLAKREFVLRRAGKDSPEVFTTRWAMSYLRGPLTRDQIATLTPAGADAPGSAISQDTRLSPDIALPRESPAAGGSAIPQDTRLSPDIALPDLGDDETTVMPEVAGGVAVRWADPAAPWLGTVGGDPASTRHGAALVARVALRYDETKADLVHDEEYECVLYPVGAHVDVTTVQAVDYDERDLRTEAPAGCKYVIGDAPIASATFVKQVQRDLVDHLARSRSLELQVNEPLKLYSRPGETPEAFAQRCRDAADAKADEAVAALRDKYEAKVERLRDQIAAAEDKVELLAEQQEGRRNEELLSTAGSILGGLLGGRSRKGMLGSVLSKSGSMAGRRSRTSQSGTRLDSAKDKLTDLLDDVDELEVELAEEVGEIEATWVTAAGQSTTLPVSLERTDVKVTQIVLAWLPVP